MKTKKQKCAICGKLKPESEMAYTWRGSAFFQLHQHLACRDANNCKHAEQHAD